MAAWASHFSEDNLGLSRLQGWEKIVSESIVRRDTVLIWGLREECFNDPPCVMFRYAVIPKRADFVQTVPTFPEHILPHSYRICSVGWRILFLLNWTATELGILFPDDQYLSHMISQTLQCWYLKSNKAPQLSLGWSEPRVRGII